jgi:KUP system potassium uptake protein
MDGRKLFADKIKAFRLSPEVFASSIAINPPHRVDGTAIYLTADPKGVPKAMLHNLKHNKVLHELTIVLWVRTVDEPRVNEAARVSVSGPTGGIWYVALSFGFSETPDVPKALRRVRIPGFDNDRMKTSYFVGRESIVLGKKGGMMRWRKELFAFLFNNAVSPTHFFKLPPDRVVELGSQTEL